MQQILLMSHSMVQQMRMKRHSRSMHLRMLALLQWLSLSLVFLQCLVVMSDSELVHHDSRVHCSLPVQHVHREHLCCVFRGDRCFLRSLRLHRCLSAHSGGALPAVSLAQRDQ